jgi:hypothetical protein
MEFSSPFEKKIEVVFVSDFFVQDVVGGAELTTEALIKGAPCRTYRIRSHQLSEDLIHKNSEKYWVFGNFANLNFDLIPFIAKSLNYSILEYDYKFCKFRSVEKHEFVEKIACKCEETQLAELVQNFFLSAKKVWWMSKNQLEFQTSKIPKLIDCNSEVLSSVFDVETLHRFQKLNASNIDRSPNALIFESPNWLKGTANAIDWCKSNGMDFDLVRDVDYDTMLNVLRKHKTLVYLPNAKDTCPRMVIEAKLLGCELVLNENVQHKDEHWFNAETEQILDYLNFRTKVFWNNTLANSGAFV